MKKLAPWDSIRASFEEYERLIRSVRLETYEERRDRSAPKIYGRLQHPNLIPYLRTTERDLLEMYLSTATSMLPGISKAIKAEKITATFLNNWGKFSLAAGYVQAVYFAEGDDLGPLRAGQGGTKAKTRKPQRKWVARQLLLLKKNGDKRGVADRKLALFIRSLIQAGKFPKGFGAGWFSKILKDNDQLNTGYSTAHLHIKDLESVANGNPEITIPPIDIKIPH